MDRWLAEVTYPVPGMFGTDEAAEKVLDRLGSEHAVDRLGSGSGFGVRDVSFAAADQAVIDGFAAAAGKELPGADVSTYRDPDD